MSPTAQSEPAASLVPEDTIRFETELARYTTPGGEPVVLGQGIGETMSVVDHPAEGSGLSYPVDSGFRDIDQVRPWLDDYLAQAEQLGACPMSREAIGTMLSRDERRRAAIS